MYRLFSLPILINRFDGGERRRNSKKRKPNAPRRQSVHHWRGSKWEREGRGHARPLTVRASAKVKFVCVCVSERARAAFVPPFVRPAGLPSEERKPKAQTWPRNRNRFGKNFKLLRPPPGMGFLWQWERKSSSQLAFSKTIRRNYYLFFFLPKKP